MNGGELLTGIIRAIVEAYATDNKEVTKCLLVRATTAPTEK